MITPVLDPEVINEPGQETTGGYDQRELTEVRRVVAPARTVALNSLIVPVRVNTQLTHGVVDTAAQRTIISMRLFDKLDKGEVGPIVVLSGAGENSRMEGFILKGVELQIGARTYTRDVVVAPITDDVLVGLDLLQSAEAIIDLQRRELTLSGQVIPAVMERYPDLGDVSVCRVYTVRKEVIPPNSLSYVPVCAHGVKAGTNVIVDASLECKGLLMGAGLIKTGVQTYLAFINESCRHVSIPSRYFCGIAEEIDDGFQPVAVRKVSVNAENNYFAFWSSTEPAKVLAQLNTTDLLANIPDHVRSVYDRVHESLLPEQKRQIAMLLICFGGVFAQHEFDLGDFKALCHEIKVDESPPFREHMRRTPLCFQAEEEKSLQHMLQAGVIQPSTSAWASAPVLVRKKDGSLVNSLKFRVSDRTKTPIIVTFQHNYVMVEDYYIEFTDYMIGISYDYNNSDLSSATGGNGGFEISIRYINKTKALQRASFK